MSPVNARQYTALPSQTVGPFFDFALTVNHALGVMAKPEARGEHVRLTIQLLDGAGAPVPDGILELWQADASGVYCHPLDERCPTVDAAFCGFGRLGTDADGRSTFGTIRPGVVAEGYAPHINVTVFSRGLMCHLFTRIYFANDPADPVLALVPADRRSTLIARQSVSGEWEHTIRLQGDDETVFFDL